MASLPELPDFRVLAEIGRGALGVVFRAVRESEPRTEVAIKMLHAGSGWDGKQLRRFAREGQLGQQIQHDYILPILEVGEDDGQPFLVMPFVDGATLAQRITARRQDMQSGSQLYLDRLREDLQILIRISRDCTTPMHGASCTETSSPRTSSCATTDIRS